MATCKAAIATCAATGAATAGVSVRITRQGEVLVLIRGIGHVMTEYGGRAVWGGGRARTMTQKGP